MTNTKLIGNKIAEARKKIGISQALFAERLFISPQAVGKWERGESMPDITTFERMATILGVDPNYFSETYSGSASEGGKADDLVQADALPDGTAKGESAKKSLGWDMSRGNWADADFSGLKKLHEKFSSSNMLRCKFVGSDLSGLLLKHNNIDSCDFSGSDFGQSRIQGSNLMNNNFSRCSLRETQFTGSNITGCDFTGADFTDVLIKSGGITGATGRSADLKRNTIVDAVWNRTSFVESYIADLVFTGTIEDCSFENCAFKRLEFHNVRLINTFFKNRSLKNIKFTNCQADRITYEFLKSGKADLKGIEVVAG